jgi:hypothetical protein
MVACVVVHVDGVRLRPWTADTNRPIVYTSDDILIWKAKMEIYIQGNSKELWEKPLPLCPPQIQHGLTLTWSLWLTTWAKLLEIKLQYLLMNLDYACLLLVWFLLIKSVVRVTCRCIYLPGRNLLTHRMISRFADATHLNYACQHRKVLIYDHVTFRIWSPDPIFVLPKNLFVVYRAGSHCERQLLILYSNIHVL